MWAWGGSAVVGGPTTGPWNPELKVGRMYLFCNPKNYLVLLQNSRVVRYLSHRIIDSFTQIL